MFEVNEALVEEFDEFVEEFYPSADVSDELRHVFYNAYMRGVATGVAPVSADVDSDYERLNEY